MIRHDLVLIGASAGGIEVLRRLVADLPDDLPAAVLICVHIPEDAPGALPSILSRAGGLKAAFAEHGEALVNGTIRIAPPGRHLLVHDGHVVLSRGPRENGHRPSIDVLFRSAAVAFGSRCIGVIMSGALDDGVAGLRAIKRRNGLAVVQDPHDALYRSMPERALGHVEVDAVEPADGLSLVIKHLVHEPAVEDPPPAPPEMLYEVQIAEADMDSIHGDEKPGEPSVFGCPECGGVLWEVNDEGLLRYRCRTGHAWSSDSLLVEQNTSLEAALWSALRALEEKAALCRGLAERAKQQQRMLTADQFLTRAHEAEQGAEVIRDVIAQREQE